jgi:hypothetical protein
MKKLWGRAKAISDRITAFISVIGFSFIYIVLFAPFSLFVERPKRAKDTNWHPWPYRSETIEECRKQY